MLKEASSKIMMTVSLAITLCDVYEYRSNLIFLTLCFMQQHYLKEHKSQTIIY